MISKQHIAHEIGHYFLARLAGVPTKHVSTHNRSNRHPLASIKIKGLAPDVTESILLGGWAAEARFRTQSGRARKIRFLWNAIATAQGAGWRPSGRFPPGTDLWKLKRIGRIYTLKELIEKLSKLDAKIGQNDETFRLLVEYVAVYRTVSGATLDAISDGTLSADLPPPDDVETLVSMVQQRTIAKDRKCKLLAFCVRYDPLRIVMAVAIIVLIWTMALGTEPTEPF